MTTAQDVAGTDLDVSDTSFDVTVIDNEFHGQLSASSGAVPASWDLPIADLATLEQNTTTDGAPNS